MSLDFTEEKKKKIPLAEKFLYYNYEGIFIEENEQQTENISQWKVKVKQCTKKETYENQLAVILKSETLLIIK